MSKYCVHKKKFAFYYIFIKKGTWLSVGLLSISEVCLYLLYSCVQVSYDRLLFHE